MDTKLGMLQRLGGGLRVIFRKVNWLFPIGHIIKHCPPSLNENLPLFRCSIWCIPMYDYGMVEYYFASEHSHFVS